MKRIVLFIDGLAQGGAQRQLVGLAILLHEQGHLVNLVTYHDISFYDEEGNEIKPLIPVSVTMTAAEKKTDDDILVSFCTYAKRDEIDSEDLSPWIGFVYTFAKYRGHRYTGLLFDRIEHLANEQNIPAVYVSTDHIGLYEKFGFEYLTDMESI